MGAEAVGEDAEEDGGHDGKAGGVLAGQVFRLGQINKAKDDGCQAARTEPAHEGDGFAIEAAAGQGHCHRQHAHYGKAEQRVYEGRRSKQALDAADQHAEEEEYREVENLAPFLGELDAVLAGMLEEHLHGETTDEGGDERAGGELLREHQAEHRQCDHGDLQEGIGHPFPDASGFQQPAAEQADAHADRHAEAELLADEAQEAGLTTARAGHRHEEQQEGHGEPVVEAGLDIEGLAHALRHQRAVDDDLAETGIGGREDGGKDARLPPGKLRKHQLGGDAA